VYKGRCAVIQCPVTDTYDAHGTEDEAEDIDNCEN
jgi:hypothetical protein